LHGFGNGAGLSEQESQAQAGDQRDGDNGLHNPVWSPGYFRTKSISKNL
jgi:hypothetical protein